MNIVPIAFAFDNNLVMPACICISSLMMNAKEDTFYDIFILHSANEEVDTTNLDRLPQYYPNCRVQYRRLSDRTFDDSFEIRGISSPAYYRLLIPKAVQEYDKIIYSDVDVIFRDDLSGIYMETELADCYFAGVNSIAHLDKNTNEYYTNSLHLDATKIIYSGNLIINSKLIREHNLIEQFKLHAKQKYRFQDMDIINIVCRNHIKYISPSFCYTNYIAQAILYNKEELVKVWSETQLNEAKTKGIVHFNGAKPWKSYCVNFDIWWEYYRNSHFFDEKFYFDFFYNKLDELDQLSLWKRIKILIRYFLHGQVKH